jgi:uncharacterized membrane protein
MEKGSWLARESLRLVVVVLPLVFLLVFWEQLPMGWPWWEAIRTLPLSQVSRFALTSLALLNLALYAIFQLCFLYRPKTLAGHLHSWRMLQLICHQLVVFTFFLVAFRALKMQLAPPLLLQYSVITLLLVLGSFLDTIPRNSTFGFRLSWTLKSDLIWRQTHRFGAQVWVYASIFMLWYPGWQAFDWLFPSYVGLLVLLPIIYSYLAYLRHLKTLAPPKS